MNSPNLAPSYLVIYPGLCETAKRHGYALAVHGSLTRDMDLIAVPWTHEAAPAEVLMADLKRHLDAMDFRELQQRHAPHLTEEQLDKLVLREVQSNKNGVNAHGATIHPHGRLSWNLYMGFGAYIDLSVLPRAGDNPEPPVRRKLNVYAVYNDNDNGTDFFVTLSPKQWADNIHSAIADVSPDTADRLRQMRFQSPEWYDEVEDWREKRSNILGNVDTLDWVTDECLVPDDEPPQPIPPADPLVLNTQRADDYADVAQQAVSGYADESGTDEADEFPTGKVIDKLPISYRGQAGTLFECACCDLSEVIRVSHTGSTLKIIRDSAEFFSHHANVVKPRLQAFNGYHTCEFHLNNVSEAARLKREYEDKVEQFTRFNEMHTPGAADNRTRAIARASNYFTIEQLDHMYHADKLVEDQTP